MLCISFQAVVSYLFAFSTLVTAVPHGKKKEGAIVSGLGIPVSNPDAQDVIANSYIVVYNKNCTDAMVQEHAAEVMSAMKKRRIGARSTDGRILSTEVTPYSIMGWKGMALEAEDSMIIDIASSPMVNYVEADTKATISVLLSQGKPPEGLKRISHAAISTEGYLFDSTAGAGTTAYVVDTGIRVSHNVSISTPC